MPGLMRLFNLGTWELLALTAGWELGSLYSSPCPAISSVPIPWVSFSSISQDRGVESAPDILKDSRNTYCKVFSDLSFWEKVG